MRCLEYDFNLSILVCRWEQTHNHKFKFFCLLLNKMVWTAFLTILQAEQKASFCIKMHSNKYLNLNLFNTLKLKTFYAIWQNVKGTRKTISFEILIKVLSICLILFTIYKTDLVEHHSISSAHGMHFYLDLLFFQIKALNRQIALFFNYQSYQNVCFTSNVLYYNPLENCS